MDRRGLRACSPESDAHGTCLRPGELLDRLRTKLSKHAKGQAIAGFARCLGTGGSDNRGPAEFAARRGSKEAT